MVDAKKYLVPDIQLSGFIIEILDDEQKPVTGIGFTVYIDGAGMSIMTDNDGILKLPRPKNEIKLSLAGEGIDTEEIKEPTEEPKEHTEESKEPAREVDKSAPIPTPAEPIGASGKTIASKASNYTLKGEVLSRLIWAKDAKDDAFLNRKNYDPERVYALKNILIKVFEEGQSDYLNETHTDSRGLFELKQLLEEGKEYRLMAILQNDSEKLREEQVIINGIKVEQFPETGSEATINLIQINSPPDGKTHILKEEESIQPSIKTSRDGEKILDFTTNAAILFNTFMLNIPYINQNANPINIDNIGQVIGSRVCFTTSMAMMMDYYGQEPNTTQSMAEK